MIGKRVGHYEILDRIGTGGASEVYRARDTRLGRDVALKVLPSEMAADSGRLWRFEREAQILASLEHPNIVTIHSVEESDGVRFLTMELVEGRSLSAAIPATGLELGPFLQIAVPLADALSAAHERGITHRDLKPDNIMLTGRGQVKILDFGLAKLDHEAALGKALSELDRGFEEATTLDGVVLGTLPYMSPEQLQSQPADPRSDLFSLGIVMHEMLTGVRPFLGETAADLIAGILRDTPTSASDRRPEVPARLSQLILHCLCKDPAGRPQSAAEVRDELAAIVRSTHSATRPGPTSITVLAFADISAEKDQEYFCEGIAEELIGSLVQIRGLQVTSRTSAFKYKSSALDIREIGRQLGVDTILEGSVRKAGDRLRIHAQLLDVSDGYPLWSGRFDRKLEDVFAIQEEIASRIVHSLQLTLTPGEQRSIQAAPTTDFLAYDYYLRGRKSFYEFRRKGVELALRMFSLAIKHDPRFSLAYAGIADCWSYLFLYADRSPGSLGMADAASRQALELNSDLAAAHTSRGLVLSLGGKHLEAEREFETAIRLAPNLFEAYYLYARDCFAQGRLEKAVQLYEKASAVRPDDYQSALLVAQIYMDQGCQADADAARRRGVRIVEELLEHNPSDVRALYMGANGLVALGEIERGVEWAALALAIEPEDPMVLYNVACIDALAGRIDPALTCLEKAVAAGLRQKGWFDHDSNLDPLRDQARFQVLMQRLAGTS